MKTSIKTTIQAGFLGVGAFFLIGGLGIVLNHIFQFSPSKVSSEVLSTFLYSFGSLFVGIMMIFLFWGLWKDKKWFQTLYWVCSAVLTAFVLLITSPLTSSRPLENLAYLGGIILGVVLLGTYLQRHHPEPRSKTQN